MGCSIFLCDRNWNMEKIFYSSGLELRKGDSLAEWLPEAEETGRKLEGENSGQVLLFLECSDGRKVPLFLFLYPAHVLAVLGRADERDFISFEKALVKSLDWADRHLREPYEDDFYEIQHMNNRLVNAGRDLMKANRRLTGLLEEVRKAHSTIALLERDELTSLYTPSAFRKAAGEKMEKEGNRAFHMIALNVSGLHQVNEILGRRAGDRFIQDLALFITGLSGEEALFCREEAASFTILAPLEMDFPHVLSENLPRFLDFYPLPGHLKVKIGAVEKGPAADLSAALLADQARIAMERGGGDRKLILAFYDEALKKRLQEEYRILDMVPLALKRKEFRLYVQNKVDVESGEVIGGEGLVRWIHPEKGMISPGLFIPLLEREDEIYSLDRYMWEEACRLLAERRRQGKKLRPLSVNLARSDLYRPDLPNVLEGLINTYGLPAEALHLEVLERAYVHDAPSLLPVLTRLRAMGFTIEIDDFGTGESSLSMLTELPADVLKLDRSLVAKVDTSPRSAAVVRAVADMARALHLSLVAEGVETKEQAEKIHSLGCRLVQGFYYSRPSPEEEFLKLP